MRICSSLASGLATAQRLLGGKAPDDEDEEDGHQETSDLTDAEREALEEMVEHLRERPVDPKFEAIVHYLVEEPRWLD